MLVLNELLNERLKLEFTYLSYLGGDSFCFVTVSVFKIVSSALGTGLASGGFGIMSVE